MDFSVLLALILRVPPKVLLCFLTLTFLLTCYCQTVLLQGRHLQGEEVCFKIVDSNLKLEIFMIISHLCITFSSSLILYQILFLLNSKKVQWIMLLLLFNIREKFRFFRKSSDSDLLPIDWQNSNWTPLSVVTLREVPRGGGAAGRSDLRTPGPPSPTVPDTQMGQTVCLSACQLQGRSRLIV